MARGIMSGLRNGQGPFSLAVVVALVLPLLLALLPAPAVSAEAQFERELAASLCITSEPDGAPRQHEEHEQCCILCPAGASAKLALAATLPVVVGPETDCCGKVPAGVEQRPDIRRGGHPGLARGPPLA